MTDKQAELLNGLNRLSKLAAECFDSGEFAATDYTEMVGVIRRMRLALIANTGFDGSTHVPGVPERRVGEYGRFID